MKMVVAVVKPFKLDEVREALVALGLHGMTVTEVSGYGQQKGQSEMYRGAVSEVTFLPKVRLELVIPDERTAEAVATIENHAHTGRIGDGKIFVLPCVDIIRIRTGERGINAL